MERIKKAIEIIKDPVARFSILTKYGFHDNLSDEEYLKRLFKIRLGYELNLDNPKTFNEKIQWLKLYDRKPEYTMMVDKYEVKKYIAKKIGGQYVIPTLGIWNHPEEIDFDSLPKQFVLKCTHNSGLGMYICRDKSKMNKKDVMKGLKKGLKENYYKGGREWPYKNIKPRIIAEKYMEEKGYIVPEDYKIYCINGKPKYIVVFHDRFNDNVEPSESVYDTEWNRVYVSLDTHFEISNKSISKPKCLGELLRISGRLCSNMPQLRLDFYIIDNTIYFGEVTFHTASGFQPMNPSELDRILGEELKLPKVSVGGYHLNRQFDVVVIHTERVYDFINEMIKDKSGGQLKDYKVFNFNGDAKIIQVDYDRFTNHKRNLYTVDWQLINAEIEFPSDQDYVIERPKCLNELLFLSNVLSADIPHVRTDFYIINDRIYFGELTFHHGSGFESFSPKQFGIEMGNMLKI